MLLSAEEMPRFGVLSVSGIQCACACVYVSSSSSFDGSLTNARIFARGSRWNLQVAFVCYFRCSHSYPVLGSGSRFMA